MKAYFYVFLYIREGRWGFKVIRREFNFYNIDVNDLNGCKTLVLTLDGDEYTFDEQEMDFVEYRGNIYGNFPKIKELEEEQFLRVEVELK